MTPRDTSERHGSYAWHTIHFSSVKSPAEISLTVFACRIQIIERTDTKILGNNQRKITRTYISKDHVLCVICLLKCVMCH